jgi:hypothetical protein
VAADLLKKSWFSYQHSLSISKLCNNHQMRPEAFVVPLINIISIL